MTSLNRGSSNENNLLTPKRIKLSARPEQQTLISIASEVLGPNSWSHSVVRQDIDYIDCENGKYSVGVAAIVRVETKSGTHHQDVGYGTSEGVSNKGYAIAHARQDAVTQGLREALCSFGGELARRLNEGVSTLEVKIDNSLTNFAEHHSPIETGTRATAEISPNMEEDLKLERKRRQQQKREEFLQQLKQKQTITTSTFHNKENATYRGPVGNRDNNYMAVLHLDDEALISTQEMDQMVQSATSVPKLRTPLISSPPVSASGLQQQWIPNRPSVTPRNLLAVSKRENYMNCRS